VFSLSTTEYTYPPRRVLEHISKVLDDGLARLLKAVPDKASLKKLFGDSDFEDLHLPET